MSLLYFPSQASSAAGALTFIAKNSASDSSSISFDDQFSSDYQNYLVDLSNIVPATNHVLLKIKLEASSSAQSLTTTFVFTRHGYTGTEFTNFSYRDTLDAKSTAGSVNISGNIANNATIAGAGLTGQIYLSGVADSSRYGLFFSNLVHIFEDDSASYGNVLANSQVAGVAAAVANADSLTFEMSSGNISSGNFTLYGIKQS